MTHLQTLNKFKVSLEFKKRYIYGNKLRENSKKKSKWPAEADLQIKLKIKCGLKIYPTGSVLTGAFLGFLLMQGNLGRQKTKCMRILHIWQWPYFNSNLSPK